MRARHCMRRWEKAEEEIVEERCGNGFTPVGMMNHLAVCNYADAEELLI